MRRSKYKIDKFKVCESIRDDSLADYRFILKSCKFSFGSIQYKSLQSKALKASNNAEKLYFISRSFREEV